MADRTAAERQRRYRAHRRGDHSLCDPNRCNPSTVAVTDAVTRHGVAGVTLGRRGRRLWEQVTADGPELRPTERVLLEEACRIADRLDKLDRLLSGDAGDWLALAEDRGDPERLVIVVDRALSEARQQAAVLKQVLAELRQSRASARQTGQSATPQGKGGAGVLDLTARIAALRGGAATG